MKRLFELIFWCKNKIKKEKNKEELKTNTNARLPDPKGKPTVRP